MIGHPLFVNPFNSENIPLKSAGGLFLTKK